MSLLIKGHEDKLKEVIIQSKDLHTGNLCLALSSYWMWPLLPVVNLGQ